MPIDVIMKVKSGEECVPIKENAALWLSVVTLVALSAVLVWLLATAEPFRLVVLFEDIGALKKDDPVVWKTFQIGKVEEIRPLIENQIGVTIRIREDYAPSITHGTEFALKRGALMGFLGTDAVEVITPVNPGTSFANREQVYGRRARTSSLLEQGRELGLRYWQDLKDQTEALTNHFKDSPYQAEIRQAIEQLGAVLQDGIVAAGKSVAEFSKDHKKDIEAALARLKAIRDKLLQAGDQPGARSIQKRIEKVEEGIRP